MASIFKPSYTKKDPRTGKKVTRKLKKWYVKYRDANGIIKKVAGFHEKATTLQLAAKLEREAELERLGIVDPFQKYRKRPLAEHIDDFEASLRSKDNTDHHVRQVLDRLGRIVDWCGFKLITDITPSRVEAYLTNLRERGRGAQSCNHYLTTIKQFCRWLVMDRRTGDNPIFHLKRQNVRTDRRHDRRALTKEEFQRLVDAAICGPEVEAVAGPERALLYILAAWTGFRRKELASLTVRSFQLVGDQPFVQVEAAYSKRRRKDTVPLHPIVVERLQEWLETKESLDRTTPIFSLYTAGGYLRDTAEMMKRDLARARTQWISEANTAEKAALREASDFLCYENDDGLFADFHANRHTFISNLGKAGVSPKVAQTLARHSDINLTMNVYSHVGLNDQVSAVRGLPGPPSTGLQDRSEPERKTMMATATDGRHVPDGVTSLVKP